VRRGAARARLLEVRARLVRHEEVAGRLPAELALGGRRLLLAERRAVGRGGAGASSAIEADRCGR
jgi:hypothetical protein